MIKHIKEVWIGESTMRISVKGRYALAAMMNLAQRKNGEECTTVIRISERLGISKIYLEQVFSLLKRAGLVSSVKGAQGGYQLKQTPSAITVYDILSAVETSLFEKTEETTAVKAPEIEHAMRMTVFQPLDGSVKEALENVSLSDLLNEAEKHKNCEAAMYYI
jgi:Rrf2 family protein